MCEDNCSAMSSCVAYNYGNSTYNGTTKACYLIPSVKNCPSGFTASSVPLAGYDMPRAATVNDLVVASDSDWVCYGKN